MLFQAYLSNDGLVEAVVVHHRRRRALTLTAEVKIPALLHRIVDLISKDTRTLPNLQILEVFRKVQAVCLAAISGCSPPVPFTFLPKGQLAKPRFLPLFTKALRALRRHRPRPCSLRKLVFFWQM